MDYLDDRLLEMCTSMVIYYTVIDSNDIIAENWLYLRCQLITLLDRNQPLLPPRLPALARKGLVVLSLLTLFYACVKQEERCTYILLLYRVLGLLQRYL